MEDKCIKGNWIFCADLSSDFQERTSKDTFRYGNKPVNRFWAEKADGVRVSRIAAGYHGRNQFFYYTPHFCIGYSISLMFYRDEQSDRDIKSGKISIPESDSALANPEETWVDHMTMEEFETFLDDVVDPNLYGCLFDCVPEDWAKFDSPYFFPPARLYRPVGKLEFIIKGVPSGDARMGRNGAQGCFNFVAKLIEKEKWWPKSDDLEARKALIFGRWDKD